MAEPHDPTEPAAVLAAVLPTLSARKRLLFWAACCRRVVDLLGDGRVGRALHGIDSFVDGALPLPDLLALHADLHAAADVAFRERWEAEADAEFCQHPAYSLSCAVEWGVYSVATLFESATGGRAPPVIDLPHRQGRSPHEHAAFAAADRAEVFVLSRFSLAIPPRERWERTRAVYERALQDEVLAQATLVKDLTGPGIRGDTVGWRTSDTVGLARGIHEDQAFDRLPFLGDALMDAGCDDDDVLSHCRSRGPHVRGCWVVDLVLAKE